MFYNMRNTYVLTMNLASNALVSSSKECIDPSSRLSNHLMATELRLEGKTLHIRALFLEWMVFFFFFLIKNGLNVRHDRSYHYKW